jgi:hypothetical protein
MSLSRETPDQVWRVGVPLLEKAAAGVLVQQVVLVQLLPVVLVALV